MDSLNRFMLEFQQLQQQEQMKATESNQNKNKSNLETPESE